MEAGDNRRRPGLRPGLRSRQLFWAVARPRNQLSDAFSDSSLNDEPSEKVGCLDALSAATSLDISAFARASADSKAPPAGEVFLFFADFPPSTRCPYSWNVLWVSQKHSLGPEIA